MAQRTWFITGVSSGFGRQLTQQLLERGDRVIGTVRDTGKVADLLERYPETYHAELLDVTDTAAIHEVLERSFSELGRIDVIISNAGYGLFGAAESFPTSRSSTSSRLTWSGRSSSSVPRCPTSVRKAAGASSRFLPMGAGRLCGQLHVPRDQVGIEGFVESVAQEVAPFGIGMTIVEPGGARTEFRYGSAQVAQLLPIYDQTPAHNFLSMLDPKNGLAPGDPARMAACSIESVDVEPAPLRMVLGSQALESTLTTLRKRIEGFEAQRDLAASTDFPPGE